MEAFKSSLHCKGPKRALFADKRSTEAYGGSLKAKARSELTSLDGQKVNELTIDF